MEEENGRVFLASSSDCEKEPSSTLPWQNHQEVGGLDIYMSRSWQDMAAGHGALFDMAGLKQEARASESWELHLTLFFRRMSLRETGCCFSRGVAGDDQILLKSPYPRSSSCCWSSVLCTHSFYCKGQQAAWLLDSGAPPP